MHNETHRSRCFQKLANTLTALQTRPCFEQDWAWRYIRFNNPCHFLIKDGRLITETASSLAVTKAIGFSFLSSGKVICLSSPGDSASPREVNSHQD
jgi:hypothetical protein